MKNAAGRIKGDLAELYDLLESKLMALESLGRTKEKFAEFLEPLVESCLPETVLRAWERSRSMEDNTPHQDSARSLDKLLSFLRNEVQSEEMIKLARTGLGASRSVHSRPHSDDPDCSTAAALVNVQDNTGRRNLRCIFCEKSHHSAECFSARKMSLEDKRKLLAQKHACFRCLRVGHSSRACRSKVKCLSCDKFHYTIMCSTKEPVKSIDTESTVISSNVLSNQSTVNENVYLQTLVLKIVFEGKQLKVRTILDSGSQKSYLSDRVITFLQLRPKSKQTIIHGLFGGRETSPHSHLVFDVNLRNLESTYGRNFEVLSQNKICGSVPKVVDHNTLKELKERNITLSDLQATEYDIELLLGADAIGDIITGSSLKLNSGVTVVETNFGYTVIGKVNNLVTIPALLENNLCSNAVSLHCANFGVTELWKLDAIGITDPTEDVKRKLAHCDTLKQFKENLNVLPNGRYELPLPFKSEILLPNNKSMTFRRHHRMCQRIKEKNQLNDYKVVFKQWEDLKIIEKVPETEIDNLGYYLPHRPVIKLSSQTMKVRPVFDASAREKNQPSLNDCLNTGPNLIGLIPDIIDRFRLYAIGLSSDIEKAFLQLSIIPEHRDFLRFFLPGLEEPMIYRHCRVVFGVCSSPFQLSASIEHLLDNSPAEFDDVTQKLKHSFYVDNCVTGVQDIKQQENFIVKATEVMARGCFNLRGWESNVPGNFISRSSGVTSLLGILWDLDKDTLKCNFNYSMDNEISKRNILAIVHKIFDPQGFLSPTTLLPKLLLQEAWTMKLKWDDPLPDNIQKTFQKWRDEIKYLEKISIPRYVEINETSELHLFVDACKSSYGACVYIRTVTPVGVNIRLIRAKSRVAPLKTLTIPRLELMACCIGARLVHSIYAALDLPVLKIIAWSDSMVALWWIKNRGDWSVFVANRINEINSLIPSQFWRHVPGDLNPADLLSRGSSPRSFSDSLWWEGPSWLLEPLQNWPPDRLAYETSEVEREKRKVRLCNLNSIEEEIPWYATRFSNYQSIIRLVSWVLRFVKNARSKRAFRETGDLTVHEMEQAEKTLVKIVQSRYFPSADSVPNMSFISDGEGIKRVKTRITERSDNPEFICPIILPGQCIFTQRLIEYYHLQNCHAGTQILLGIIRERFWIVRGRRAVRKVVKNCVRCHRYKAKSPGCESVPLPGDRVNDAAVFEVVGVDLAGPLYVKGGEKVWIVLFTCAIYRAIHLELTSSLSTDTFLMSLRRFVARRGRPRIIYSDNGTNFRGAQRELSNIDWEKILRQTATERIIWKFNPPTAAWWGGWWERLVRMVKELLRRTLGNAVLTTEELQTVLCDCESIINSRPLTYLSENSDDLVPLSPAMFLIENRNSGVPDVDFCDSKNLRRRVRHRQKLFNDLRHRFRKEYLGLLVQNKIQKGPSSELRLGEIVLIGDDVKKRMHWPLARVVRLIPGKDGKVRTVELKTQAGVLLRPIQQEWNDLLAVVKGMNGAKKLRTPGIDIIIFGDIFVCNNASQKDYCLHQEHVHSKQ
ncbi:hypothetical protein X975_08509, partial [Stegodyphus mimosarum]